MIKNTIKIILGLLFALALILIIGNYYLSKVLTDEGEVKLTVINKTGKNISGTIEIPSGDKIFQFNNLKNDSTTNQIFKNISTGIYQVHVIIDNHTYQDSIGYITNRIKFNDTIFVEIINGFLKLNLKSKK